MAEQLETPPRPGRGRRPEGDGRPKPANAKEYQSLVVDRLVESRLTPNAISLTGFALCLVAAVLAWQELWLAAGLTFVVGSVCDTLDGRYARRSGKGTKFGAFLDSTLDRVEEGFVLAAIGAVYATREDELVVAVVVLAAVASLMVSYTRARAEGLGIECKVGIADRATRVVILSAGLILAAIDTVVLEVSLYVLAASAVITVFQRIFHVRKQLLAG